MKTLVAWISGLALLWFAFLKVPSIVAAWNGGGTTAAGSHVGAEHFVALVAEFLIGAALLVPRTRVLAACLATLLGIAFCAFVALRGPSARPCGCLGSVSLTYGEELLLAVAVLVAGMANLTLFAQGATTDFARKPA